MVISITVLDATHSDIVDDTDIPRNSPVTKTSRMRAIAISGGTVFEGAIRRAPMLLNHGADL